MKRLLTSTLVIASMVLTPALKADDMTTEVATDYTTEDSATEGTPVGQGANEGAKAAKKKQWQNIALAVGAVAVAITALILVANNDGHKSHHDKKD
jgi:hypothetical protein